jgi:hypothetical protein
MGLGTLAPDWEYHKTLGLAKELALRSLGFTGVFIWKALSGLGP